MRPFVNQIDDNIRIGIFYLGLHLIPPISILALICSIVGLIFTLYFRGLIFSVPLAVFFAVISILFFTYAMHYALLPTKRARLIADALGNDPRIILYIAKKVKKWLENIIAFMEKQPSIGDIKNVVASPTASPLQFLRPSLKKRLIGRIEKKGNYLSALIREVSKSRQIPPESIEELINCNVVVNLETVKEINISYEQIERSLKVLQNLPIPFPIDPQYIRRRIKERIDYLESKKEILNTQIKWIKELDKRKENIFELLEIIKEFSTGKAVSKLSLLLSKVNTAEDLMWLVKFANSRKGFPISNLLGLKIMKNNGKETLNWYKKTVLFSIDTQFKEDLDNGVITKELKKEFKNNGITLSDNATVKKEEGDTRWEITDGKKFIIREGEGKLNIYSEDLQTLKEFLRSFVWLRSEALEELWQNFKEWNEVNKQVDLNQPIATGLTFGYSAALRKILQRLCKENRQLRVILISSEVPGAEEILRAELLTDCPELKKDNIIIMPFEVIERREIQRQIGAIFVGIESINRQGDIVHPRGGSEVIRKIKDTQVYAFGESYKVQDFTEDDIDYTKLSLFRHEYVDYVITDHGVHEREGVNNLDCCAKYWKEKLKQKGICPT